MTYLRYIAIFALTAAAAVACGRLYACREDKRSVVLRALTAALLSYLAIQSGIARRMTADALLPAWDGTAWPGRTALFLGLTVLFMALYATGRGEKLLAGLDRAMSKDRWRWLTAAGMTGLFLLWTWRVTVIAFMTNDDVTLMQTIALIPSQGLEAASRAYSHFLFCGLMSLFYRIDPHGYWYGGYHMLAIAVSLTVVGRCILTKLSRRGGSALAGAGIFALLGAGLVLHATAELSFTVTPALLGTAAASLVLCRNDTAGRGGHIAMDLGCGVMLLLIRLQRPYTARCVMCFWALAVVYQLLHTWLSGRPERKKQLVTLLLCAAVTVGLFIVPGYIRLPSQGGADQDSSDYNDYVFAEQCRSQVMDYMVENLTNEQLQAVGLPPELSNLLRAWYFMDERINTETFWNIADMYYDPAPSSKSLAAATSMEDDGRVHTMALTAIGLPLLLAAAVLSLCRRGGRKCWLELLGALAAAGGGTLLLLYLIYQGRLLLRTYLVVVIPTAVMLILFGLSGPGPDRDRPSRPWLGRCLMLTAAALGVLACLSARSAPYAGQSVSRAEAFAFQRATEGYAASHPDIYFVTNFIRHNLDPFHDPAAYPENMHRWGDNGTTSDPDRLYADAFFRQDVQFMYETPSTILALLQYLSLDFGPVQAVCLAQPAAATFVVDIDQVGPGGDYTGWYEQNGMTYYFLDGQALTGRQTIDGKEYTFAGTGFDGQFTAALSPAGEPIYTTTAYSLLDGD